MDWELVKGQYGNWASVIGLGISGIGLLATWLQAKKATTAADAAKVAATNTRDEIRRIETQQLFIQLKNRLDELYRAHRDAWVERERLKADGTTAAVPKSLEAMWHNVMVLIDSARSMAVKLLHADAVAWNPSEVDKLQDAAAVLRDLEQQIQQPLLSMDAMYDGSRSNSDLSRLRDSLESFKSVHGHARGEK